MAISSTHIYLETDNLVKLEGLQDSKTGNYINDATVKLSLCFSTVKNLDAAAITQNGSNVVIPCTAHGLAVGDNIRLIGTINYDGEWTVAVVPGANTFEITTSFVAETCTGLEELYKVVPNAYQLTMSYETGSNGDYYGTIPDTTVLYIDIEYYEFVDVTANSDKLLKRCKVKAMFSPCS